MNAQSMYVQHAPRVAAARAHRSVALAAVSALLLSCSVASLPSWKIQGGREARSYELDPDKVDEQLEPLISGSARAQAKLTDIKSSQSKSTTLLYTGLGILAPCIALSNSSPPGEPTGLSYLGLGSCAGTIVLEVLGMALLPGKDDYAQVLEEYNRDFPLHPYASTELGVGDPR